ncbi:SDR family NAD(P)-dependent oxidoreductase [Clavibacter sepedonicus]|uniref:Short chain oxidoreductase n=1 Tax=Clavibacter sepedonicus TaxID=31964 RepID=B0RCB4_CLASE|nr:MULTISPECIES: SDR family NAD(P)-dependent oxidoreductase [Clavibacter]MBD5382941.1 SDR family NAD(P)-dependent oxidoreductase [Clavibacter sp.]OQJ53992.1 dehydrogenase [Clavibacter sepedonicus]UUK65521.1 SDR family NAD(P)-dependent oxidoreductase [Clavibacter sepedonicus]CAQ03002.1 putative short chain oxidoreductase [Clavibacter sepedonicus]
MIALVTGGNKGIGREIAAGLAGLGHTVVIGARDLGRGEEAASALRAAGGDVGAVALDVTDRASVAAAIEVIRGRHGRLDALVNNAGISHRPGADFAGQVPGSGDVDHVRFVFETNVLGVMAVTEASLPLLRLSDAPRIVNVSSSAGSLAAISDFANADPIALGYVPSKTAVTALTMMYARGLAAEGILVNAVCPGFVATDLNGFRGVRTPEQGARQAVRMATIAADGPTGTFTDEDGPVAW